MQINLQKGMSLLELTVVLLILIALAGLAVPYVANVNQLALCQATDASMQAIKTAIMGGGANSGFYQDTLGYYPKATKTTTPDFDLRYLLEQGSWANYNPKTAVGWRGPYLTQGSAVPAGLDSSFSVPFDPATASAGTVHRVLGGSQILDAWGRPIILQVPYDLHTATYNFDYARLVSAGAGNGLGISQASIETKIQYDSSNVTTPFPKAEDRADDRVLYLKMPDLGTNIPCNEI